MKLIIQLILVLTFCISCGTNIFEGQEPNNTAEDAAQALERGDSSGAISMLESALEDEPENYVYVSLLAMAYAQRAGFDPVAYILSIASSSDGASLNLADSNDITQTFSSMPDATASNISDIGYAVTLLARIPSAERCAEDVFKMSVFQVGSVTLQAKAFDADGDGDLSPLEIANLSPEAALAMLATLTAADSNMDGADTSAEANKDAFGSKLSSINTEIGVTSSDTEEEKAEKLRDFLGGDE